MLVPSPLEIPHTLRYVGRPLLYLFLYDIAIVYLFLGLHWGWVSLPHIPLTLLGSAIGIIAAFRNNSSYSRWWEARTLWGAIVNQSRSWSRQVLTSPAPTTGEEIAELTAIQKQLVYYQIAYVHALRQHLRKLSPWKDLEEFLPKEELEEMQESQNLPLALQVKMAAGMRYLLNRGWIDPMQWAQMNATLSALMDAQGGSERIKNTPMPQQYDHLPQVFIQCYCLLLPLALVAQMGWYTPLGSTLVGFIFLALNQIGRDLEDPFDNTIYDVPLKSITKRIEIDLRQLLEERPLPKPEAPVRGVLW